MFRKKKIYIDKFIKIQYVQFTYKSYNFIYTDDLQMNKCSIAKMPKDGAMPHPKDVKFECQKLGP